MAAVNQLLPHILNSNYSITGMPMVDGIILANIAPVILSKLYDWAVYAVNFAVFSFALTLLSIFYRSTEIDRDYYLAQTLSKKIGMRSPIYYPNFILDFRYNDYLWKERLTLRPRIFGSLRFYSIYFQPPFYPIFIVSTPFAPEKNAGETINNSEIRMSHMIYSLNIFGWKNAIFKFLLKIYDENKKILDSANSCFILERNTLRGISFMQRDRRTLYLPAETERIIFDDIAKFMKDSGLYAKNQIPYHRGYLFYGPPGTGKSSIIRVISKMFQNRTYIVNLDSGITNKSMINIIETSCSTPTIIVFEDYDRTEFAESEAVPITPTANSGENLSSILAALKSPQEQTFSFESKMTLASFINILDSSIGVFCPIIYIFTVNDINKVQKVLRRPGRIDVEVEITYMKLPEIKRMISSMFDTAADDKRVVNAAEIIIKKCEEKVTPAMIQNYCLCSQSFDDFYKNVIAASKVKVKN